MPRKESFMENVIVALTLLFIFVLSISKLMFEKRKEVKCWLSHGGDCSSNKQVINKKMAQQLEIKQLM
jgi:hypothetical protein